MSSISTAYFYFFFCDFLHLIISNNIYTHIYMYAISVALAPALEGVIEFFFYVFAIQLDNIIQSYKQHINS